MDQLVIENGRISGDLIQSFPKAVAMEIFLENEKKNLFGVEKNFLVLSNKFTKSNWDLNSKV